MYTPFTSGTWGWKPSEKLHLLNLCPTYTAPVDAINRKSVAMVASRSSIRTANRNSLPSVASPRAITCGRRAGSMFASVRTTTTLRKKITIKRRWWLQLTLLIKLSLWISWSAFYFSFDNQMTPTEWRKSFHLVSRRWTKWTNDRKVC